MSARPMRWRLRLELRVRTPVTELARQRIARGLTQRELADALGISPPTLSGVENGWTSPWPRLRADCARILGLPTEVLFPDDEHVRRR